MKTNAKTIAEYLETLPEDKREVLRKIRKVILKNLPKGYEEAFDFGMISYQIPLSRYAETYNGKPLMYAALASQKNYFAIYLMCTYGDKELNAWFQKKWKESGKKLHMGKSCIRFKKLEDVPLEVIGEVVKKVSVVNYIKQYEKVKGRIK